MLRSLSSAQQQENELKQVLKRLILSENPLLGRMARGNQRDQAREKAAKANKGKTVAASEQGANQGLSKEQRMERWPRGGVTLSLRLNSNKGGKRKLI